MTNKLDIKAYMSTLAANGDFHNVSLPDKPLLSLMVYNFTPHGSKIARLYIGRKVEALAMLCLANENDLYSIIEIFDYRDN